MQQQQTSFRLPIVRGIAIAIIGGILWVAGVLFMRLSPLLTSPPLSAPPDLARLGSGEALIHEAEINRLVKQGKDAFLPLLNHTNPWVRRNAVKGLSRLQDPSTVDALITALKDTDPWARMWAAGALGRIGNSVAVEPLQAVAATDVAPHVQSAAREALKRLRQ